MSSFTIQGVAIALATVFWILSMLAIGIIFVAQKHLSIEEQTHDLPITSSIQNYDDFPPWN